MKRLIFIPAIIMAMGITMPHNAQDTPSRIEIAAQVNTDRQIDSVYRHSRVSPFVDAVRDNFRELRSHMDSINALNIIWQRKFDSVSAGRHALTQTMLRISLENDSIRMANEKMEKDIVIMKRTPDMLFLFVCILVATLLGQGIYHAWSNRKSHE